MPELPDIAVYVECIAQKTAHQRLARVRIANPFLLRSVDPPVSAIEGQQLRAVTHVGKRVVLEFENGPCLVVHLMIAGRFHWKELDAPLAGKQNLAALDFETGSLVLTEARSKRRASFNLVARRADVAAFDPGGIDVTTCTGDAFAARLTAENHTVKRALTDPRICSGIGNAYSDEILHRAQLSPLHWTSRLADADLRRLHRAVQTVLGEWTDRLRAEAAANKGWPRKVTAFRKEMAVHGRHGQPCPVCASPIQRIAYADNETNYCPTCQTGGKLLADRSLSRLLKDDWPRTLVEFEELKRAARG